jgi:hypothetical protein
MHSVASVFTRGAKILGQQLSNNENNCMVLLSKIVFFRFPFSDCPFWCTGKELSGINYLIWVVDTNDLILK